MVYLGAAAIVVLVLAGLTRPEGPQQEMANTPSPATQNRSQPAALLLHRRAPPGQGAANQGSGQRSRLEIRPKKSGEAWRRAKASRALRQLQRHRLQEPAAARSLPSLKPRCRPDHRHANMARFEREERTMAKTAGLFFGQDHRHHRSRERHRPRHRAASLRAKAPTLVCADIYEAGVKDTAAAGECRRAARRSGSRSTSVAQLRSTA